MKRIVIPLLALLLGACAITAPAPEQRYHVLDAPAAAPAAPRAARHAATLLVAPTTAAPFYDSQDIVFSRSAGTRGTYQFSAWTEAPSRRLNTLLIARLESAGAFAIVVPATSGVRGDLLLRTHVDEIFHDATTPPGMARVVLSAELSDRTKRVLVGRRTFSVAVPVSSYDADGAVRGIGLAVSMVLDELTAWVDSSAPS